MWFMEQAWDAAISHIVIKAYLGLKAAPIGCLMGIPLGHPGLSYPWPFFLAIFPGHLSNWNDHNKLKNNFRRPRHDNIYKLFLLILSGSVNTPQVPKICRLHLPTYQTRVSIKKGLPIRAFNDDQPGRRQLISARVFPLLAVFSLNEVETFFRCPPYSFLLLCWENWFIDFDAFVTLSKSSLVLGLSSFPALLPFADIPRD